MNDKEQSEHNQQDSFKPAALNSCGQRYINESNASSLQETRSGKLHALFWDSSAAPDFPSNGESSTFNSSLPGLSHSEFPHGSQEVLSQENLSDSGMQRASNLDFKGINDEFKLISARNNDEDREATLPAKFKHINESSNSLRVLLSSEASNRVDKRGSLNEKARKDREAFEGLHKIVPSSETGLSVNHSSQEEAHVFPEKWYEDAEDSELTSATFSGPIAYSGTVLHSGPIPYSGSLSYRSDSSTSTRSFAFPILATEWTSSPVKMAPPDPRLYKQRRKRWLFSCFCCKQSSTLYE